LVFNVDDVTVWSQGTPILIKSKAHSPLDYFLKENKGDKKFTKTSTANSGLKYNMFVYWLLYIS